MSKPKVLVVDDDKYACDVIKLMLEKKGCDAIVASDGAVAAEKAESEKPDLVLLDIMLQDMSGYEVLNIIKTNPNTKDIPVIMVTGKDDYDSMAKAKGLAADDYLTKPFLSDELLQKISKYFK